MTLERRNVIVYSRGYRSPRVHHFTMEALQMRRPAPALAAVAATLILATFPAHAVNNGLLDDTTHPAVGFLVGSQDPGGCFGQAVGCSALLIAPDLVLTSAACANDFNDALATPGFISHVW